VLQRDLPQASPLVAEHMRWALGQQRCPSKVGA